MHGPLKAKWGAKGAPAQQPPSQQATALRCQTEALSLQSDDPVAVRRPFDGGKCLQAVSPGPKQEDQHHSFEFQENDRMYSWWKIRTYVGCLGGAN